MYDLVVIGGGPGGYAAALYAHNFGLSVALVEKDEVGGTCLLRGCIPAKAWLHTAHVHNTVARSEEFGVLSGEPKVDWARALGRKNQVVERVVKGLKGLLGARNVEIKEGFGRLRGGSVEVLSEDGGVETLETRNIVLATGSVPRAIPGYEVDGQFIVTSDEALDWPEQPARVAIIGAGAIGAEFASFLGDLGTEVHLFEMLDQILPGMEPEAARVLARSFRHKGISTYTGVQVGPPQRRNGSVTVPYPDGEVEVDVVLVAVGRAPVTDGVGIEGSAIEVERGFVLVDPATMATAQPGVYAVGDIVAGTPQLAHSGFAEGIAAVTHMATGEVAAVDYRAIPMVVYTAPEVAAVGLTEDQARTAGYDVQVGSHAMGGIGRAVILGETGGTVKVIAETGGPILGATVADPAAGEIIHELMYTVGWEALPAEAAAFIHAHPTVSEAIGETLLALSGRSLH